MSKKPKMTEAVRAEFILAATSARAAADYARAQATQTQNRAEKAEQDARKAETKFEELKVYLSRYGIDLSKYNSQGQEIKPLLPSTWIINPTVTGVTSTAITRTYDYPTT